MHTMSNIQFLILTFLKIWVDTKLDVHEHELEQLTCSWKGQLGKTHSWIFLSWKVSIKFRSKLENFKCGKSKTFRLELELSNIFLISFPTSLFIFECLFQLHIIRTYQCPLGTSFIYWYWLHGCWRRMSIQYIQNHQYNEKVANLRFCHLEYITIISKTLSPKSLI